MPFFSLLFENYHMYTKKNQHTEIKNNHHLQSELWEKPPFTSEAWCDRQKHRFLSTLFLYYKKIRWFCTYSFVACSLYLIKHELFPMSLSIILHHLSGYVGSQGMCAPSFTSSSELIRCYYLTKVSLPFLHPSWKKQVLRYLEGWKLFHHLACRCINMSFL